MKTNEVYIYKNPNENMPGNHSGYKVVIWTLGGTFHIASFYTVEQFSKFCKKFHIDLIPAAEYDSVYIFKTNKKIMDSNRKFWKLSDLPKSAKPIKALSNGCIVNCFYTNTRNALRIYRPNPNAHEIYKPLTTEKHIAHHKKYGVL